MAFNKVAKAKLTKPGIKQEYWENYRSNLKGRVKIASEKNSNLIHQASEIIGRTFDPNEFLLSHVTIVCSVDTVEVPKAKLGKLNFEGQTIHRKWADYRITPETDKFTNNNLDSFSRDVLTKSAHTFVGGMNYIEHIQVEALSKGRIIDAALRDIGPSLYVDLLVATEKKHTSLIDAISSGKMGTLSMGCFLGGTLVSLGDGTRVPIEDLDPGDMVLTHKGRVREVQNKQIKTYRGEIRHIKASGIPSTITATANHGFQVLRQPPLCVCGCGEPLEREYHGQKTKKSATQKLEHRFKRGHSQRIYNSNGVYSLEEARERREKLGELKNPSLEKVRADELQVGDFLCFPKVQSSQNFEEGFNSARARLIGYFLAEGSFLKRKGDPVEVQFNFSITERETYVQEVVELLEQEFPGNKPWVQDRIDRNTSTVHLTGRKVAEWFKEHCGEYSHKKKVSQSVFNLPSELHKELVGAWLNGDGTFNATHKSLVGTSTSYDLACQIQAMASGFGVYTRMDCIFEGKCVEIWECVGGDSLCRSDVNGKLPFFNVYVGGSYTKELSTFTDKVESYPQKKGPLREFEDSFIFPITEIETDDYEGFVYNLEVEEDHTYIVEGVAVHNCQVTQCICTKCGNVAKDETDLCTHIKYAKGQQFYDELGQMHRVAELCGHPSLGPTGGVNFIEASWVGVPAFQGAVLRNTLEMNSQIAEKMEHILSTVPPQWEGAGTVKAASSAEIPLYKQAFGAFEEDEVEEQRAPEAPEEQEQEVPPEESQDPLEDAKNELFQNFVEDVQKNVEKVIRTDGQEDAMFPEETSSNDTIQSQASQIPRDYAAAVNALKKISNSSQQFIDNLALYNTRVGILFPVEIYRTSAKVGSIGKFASSNEYLHACRQTLAVPSLSESQRETLLMLGGLLQNRSH